MSDSSHRHRKLTSEEVYQDAKKILEEYLKRKLEGGSYGNKGSKPDKKYSRSASYKAASQDNVVADSQNGKVDGPYDDAPYDDGPYDDDEGFSRSKTMPSTFKSDGTSREKDVGNHGNSKTSTATRIDESSPETDVDDSEDEETRKRQKKSFFKRAAERLIHAFHRDSRSGDEDVDVHGDGNVKNKKRKKKKMKQKIKKFENDIHDSPDMNNTTRHVKETHAHIDYYFSNVGNDRPHADTLQLPGNRSPRENHSSSSSRRNSAGKKLLDSIRKSFRKNKKKDSSVSASKSAEPVSQEDRDKSYARSNSTPDRNAHLQAGSDSLDRSSSQGQRSRSSSRSTEYQKEKKSIHRKDKPTRLDHVDIVVSQSEDNSRPRTIQVHGLHLDRDSNAAGIPCIPEPDLPPGFMGNVEISMDIEDRKEMVQADDGLWEVSEFTRSRNRTKYLRQNFLETDGGSDELLDKDDVDSPISPPDELDSPTSPEEKERTINRIVQKLIEIGDNLEAEGDIRYSPEVDGASGGQPTSNQRLSSLERDIIACLRVGGDNNQAASQIISDAVSQQVYHKFSSTLRQSVGDEVNWNQMALVFHTTKSALKVVGAGTKMANQLKDMTLKFVTEKCASWIVDQGGWESLVSDTDSELD